LPLGAKADVDRAVEAAHLAFPAWSGKPAAERATVLLGIAQQVREHADELAELDILDHGTPTGLAHGLARSTGRQIEYFAQLSRSMTGVVAPVETSAHYFYQREPIGVCALVLPWNLPLITTVMKVAAALAAGNTCVVKPASVDSLVALRLAEIFEQGGLPAGAVNVATGPGDVVGEALASHPGVDMIALVGSCETGKRIMELASRTVKRLALELGGKNPFLVLEDAVVDAAVDKGVFASFFNSGMVCAAPGRYYIHDRLYDQFVEAFADAAANLVVGDPRDSATQMGPLVSEEHRRKVERYIQEGISSGARLVLGGERPAATLDRGYYVLPTVFADVTQDMSIAREEIFGPVVALLRLPSDDSAVQLANDTRFGLCASVWSRNVPRALEVASKLRVGTVWVNDHMRQADEMPWGGFRESGFGKDGSMIGLEEFTQVKQVTVNLAWR
jgi:acyl-CoA reductase-like NAD-dependent aldehyde dehydrogenase